MRRRRPLVTLQAALVVLALLALPPSAAAAAPSPPTVPVPTATDTALPTPTMPVSSQGTNLSVSPAHGMTTTVLTVEGTGFTPNGAVHVQWDAPSTVLASATADGHGHFVTTATIPRAATPGGHEIVATGGPQTAYALVTVDPQPMNTVSPDEGLCVAILGAQLCIPTPTSIVYGLANNVTHFWGHAFTLVTAGFSAALTSSPDMTQQASFSGIASMQQQLATASGGLLVFFLTIGVLAGYLTAIGRGHFQPLLAPIGRAIFVTGFIAGYSTIMSTGFTLINLLTQGINSVSVGSTQTGFVALGQAFGTIADLTSPIAVIKGFVILAGLLLSILAVIIRYTALGFLDLLYTIGPLCLVTYVSPQFSFLARWWWRTTFGLALYPVGYALVLKIIANVLTGTSAFGVGSDSLVSALGALGLVLMIYRVPALVGSAVGAGASVFGAAASAATDAGIAAGIALATRGVGDRVLGNKPTPGGQP
jgi:hypothetical protein